MRNDISSRKMRILFNISILLSLALALLSILFFGHQVLVITGSSEGLIEDTTAYVGFFLAVFFLSHKGIGLIVRVIKKFTDKIVVR